MTSIWGEVAAGVSTSWPRERPKAWAIRQATARVGLARPRSISESMEREGPQAAEVAWRVQVRVWRGSRRREQSKGEKGSSGEGGSSFCFPFDFMAFHYIGIRFRSSRSAFHFNGIDFR